MAATMPWLPWATMSTVLFTRGGQIDFSFEYVFPSQYSRGYQKEVSFEITFLSQDSATTEILALPFLPLRPDSF